MESLEEFDEELSTPPITLVAPPVPLAAVATRSQDPPHAAPRVIITAATTDSALVPPAALAALSVAHPSAPAHDSCHSRVIRNQQYLYPKFLLLS